MPNSRWILMWMWHLGWWQSLPGIFQYSDQQLNNAKKIKKILFQYFTNLLRQNWLLTKNGSNGAIFFYVVLKHCIDAGKFAQIRIGKTCTQFIKQRHVCLTVAFNVQTLWKIKYNWLNEPVDQIWVRFIYLYVHFISPPHERAYVKRNMTDDRKSKVISLLECFMTNIAHSTPIKLWPLRLFLFVVAD